MLALAGVIGVFSCHGRRASACITTHVRYRQIPVSLGSLFRHGHSRHPCTNDASEDEQVAPHLAAHRDLGAPACGADAEEHPEASNDYSHGTPHSFSDLHRQLPHARSGHALLPHLGSNQGPSG